MQKAFPKGTLVSITSDNENYQEFACVPLKVSSIARSKQEHPGYDSSINEPLYDLETLEGKPIPFSLYQWEITKISKR